MGKNFERGQEEAARFLKEIEGWRQTLARNMVLRNRGLSADDLNAAVERTIDRVVFLRMAEDRQIEPDQQLLKLSARAEIYPRFIRDLCRKAERKYRCSLFHFQPQSDIAHQPDRVTPALVVDDQVFKPILESLYADAGALSHFGALPVEILGTVYERFLGKVIRLTDGGQVEIEEKPEVRKAGGVYYTPASIVDYIVGQTVGRQIEGRSPAQLAGDNREPPLRVLDMACGSGCFLLGAYQRLLDHCLKWYLQHGPETFQKAVYRDAGSDDWRLTAEEKKRILTTHVFGVDRDARAVEVTRLSLLLKLLEDGPGQAASRRPRPFDSQTLPDLAETIKCGNSLIGPSYFTGKPAADADTMRRVNPLDWEQAFPGAMKAGGFQCILGNPPYVRIQAMKQWAPWEVDIYRELFETGKAGNYDIYVVFIERALKLLHPRGQLGFICPHKFFNSRYGQPLRAIIARGRHLSHVVHFGSQQVFPRATTYSCLLFLTSAPVSQFRFTKVDDLHAWRTAGAATEGLVEASAVAAGPWNFAVGRGAALFAKLAAMPCKLGDVAEVFVGLQTSADDVYILDFVGQSERTYRLRSKSLGQEWTLEKDLVHPLVSGTDVSRYGPLGNRQYIVFPYAVEEGRASLLDFEILKRDWPQTAAYLLENKKRLEGREKGRMQGPLWHGYVYRKNMARQSLVKLCVPRLVGQLHAAYDRDGSHFLDNVDVGGVRWKPPHAGQGLEYLLALLNCRLMRWYFPQVSASFRGGWRSANRQFLALLPIRVIDGNSTKDAAIHRQLVGLAGAVQTLHAELAAATSAGVTGALRRKIDATDAEIDRLVYDLYGLTGEEIAVVEGESARVPLAAVKE